MMDPSANPYEPAQRDSSSLLSQQSLQTSNLIEAVRLYHELEHHPGIAVAVVDDACYERTEAMVAVLATDFSIPEERLGRVFVINPYKGSLLSHEKPLARNENPLQQWFNRMRTDGELVPGNRFHYEDQVFFVDDYCAIRCQAIPQIYFDESPIAHWGIGHVAPTLDGQVLDPSIGKGPLSFSEWRDELHLEGMITLRSTARGFPELDRETLDTQALERVLQASVNGGLIADGNFTHRQDEFREAINSWQEIQKSILFNQLFQSQIHDGAILPRQMWSPLFPGPLTFRGERYGSSDHFFKSQLNHSLERPWHERKEKALTILKPFRAFRDMILAG